MLTEKSTLPWKSKSKKQTVESFDRSFDTQMNSRQQLKLFMLFELKTDLHVHYSTFFASFSQIYPLNEATFCCRVLCSIVVY